MGGDGFQVAGAFVRTVASMQKRERRFSAEEGCDLPFKRSLCPRRQNPDGAGAGGRQRGAQCLPLWSC